MSTRRTEVKKRIAEEAQKRATMSRAETRDVGEEDPPMDDFQMSPFGKVITMTSEALPHGYCSTR